MTLLEIIGVIVAAIFTVNFVWYLRSGDLVKDFSALRTLRQWKWVGALLGTWGVLILTIALAYLILSFGGPVMRFSWLSLLATPAEQPSAGGNLVMAGAKVPGFAWIFVVLLGLNIPRLAKNEERSFRQGIRTKREAVVRSIKFGLAHCLIGVPIGVGVALILPGLFWCWIYTKGGVRLSTAWHALHNWTILAMLVAVLIRFGHL